MTNYFPILVLLSIIFQVTSDVAYIGHTKNDLFINSTLHEIKSFQSSLENGITQDDEKNLYLQSQGLYLLSCVLLLEIKQYNSVVKVLANLNQELVSDSSIQSWSTELIGSTSIKLSGIVRGNKNDSLHIYLESTNGNILVKSLSQLYLVLLSTYDIEQFLSVSLRNDVFIEKIALQLYWATFNLFGSFITTNLFNKQGGNFVAEKFGVYIVLGNFVFNNKQEYLCTVSVFVLKNNNEVLIESTLMTEMLYFTINVARSIQLEKGDRLWLKVTSSCLKVVLSSSTTYSVGYLDKKEGFSSFLHKIESYIVKDNWNVLDLFNFNHKNQGGFLTNHVNHLSNFVSFEDAGLVLVTVNLLLKVPLNTTLIKLAVTKNVEAITLDQKNHFGDKISLVSQSFSSTSQQTISFVSLIEVAKNDHLRLNIFSSTSEQWFVLSKSTVSLVVLSVIQGPQDQELRPFLASDDWELLSCLKVSNEELVYSVNGLFSTHKSNVFFVTTSVLIVNNLLEDEIKIALIYNKAVFEKKKILLASEEQNINSNFTLKFSSIFVMNIGQNIGIFMQSLRSINLKVSCSISFLPFGSIENVIGFQGNLAVSIEGSNDAVELKNFYDPSRTEFSLDYHYNNGQYFSFGEGVFKAPVKGIYLISANIVVKGLIPNDAQSVFVTACLNINNKHSTYCIKRSIVSLRTKKKISLTLSMGGPIRFFKEDKINLVVFSSSSGVWFVEKSTSFSALLIDDEKSAKGFFAILPRVRVRLIKNYWSLISGWTAESKVGHRFVYTSKESPVIDNSEKVVAHYSGTYIFSLQLYLKRNSTSHNYQLFIKVGEQAFVCDEAAGKYDEISLTCSMVIALKKEDECSFLIKSEAEITEQSFFTDKVNDIEKGYLSIYLILDEKPFQASSFVLKDHLEFSDSLEILKPWQLEKSSYYCNSCGFSASSGILTAESSGCYFISLDMTFIRSLGNATLSVHSFPTIKEDANIFTGISSVSISSVLKLRIVGTIRMDANAQLASSFYSTGPGSLPSRGTTYSYTKISNYQLKTCDIYTKPTSFTSNLIGEDIITEWVHYISKSVNSNFALYENGIYFVSANLITTSSGTKISFGVRNEISSLFTATYYTAPDTTFTFLLSGVVLAKTSKMVLSLYLSSNHIASVQSQSSLSLAYIGSLKLPAILLTVKSPENHHWIMNEWIAITAFEEEHVLDFFYKNKVVVPKVTGVYLISAHVIVSVEMPMQLTLGVFVNEESTVTDLKLLKNTDTLTVSRSIYLRQGSVLSIMMHSNSEAKYQVETKSSFSLVLVESLGADDIPMTPAITSELHSGSYLELAAGMECNLECNAVPSTDISFKWYQNNQEIIGHNQNFLRICSSGSGFYQCQAISNSVGPISKATQVVINEVNECRDEENCKGANMTCIDTPFSYKCDCLYNLNYYGGQCVENNTIQNNVEEQKGSSIPITLFVLVPAVILIIVIILICTVFLCLKRRRSRDDNSDMEFLQLDLNEEVIPMQSLNGSQILDGNPDIDKSSIGTSISYSLAISLSADDEDDAEGFEELKWKRLSDASTVV